jgi:DNA-directed RNA polymerase specialized sigma24 family protein
VKRKKVPRLDQPAATAEEAVEPAPPKVGSLFSVDDRLSLTMLIEKADLSDREAEAISLRLEGLEDAALAEALGESSGNTRVIIHRAIKNIREIL